MFIRLGTRSETSVAALIPNCLTVLALSCGLASIHFSCKAGALDAVARWAEAAGLAKPIPPAPLSGPLWDRALLFILLSAIFDALDGRAARLLRVTSKFGAVLDSLSDFVSFGVAPAIILHEWTLGDQINRGGVHGGNIFGLIAVMTFALCSGLRLARFTAAVPPAPTERGKHAAKPSSSAYFIGMPTPAAAGAVLIPAMLTASRTFNWPIPEWFTIVYTLVIAFLMISRVPMFSLKKIRVSRPFVAPILVLVGVLVFMMMYDAWLTLSVVAGAYVISIPAAILASRRSLHSGAHAGPLHAAAHGDH